MTLRRHITTSYAHLPHDLVLFSQKKKSAKGSASKSSKEADDQAASPTTEVVPGRLFVSFILFEIILILFIYLNLTKLAIFTLMNRPSRRSNPHQSQRAVMRKIMKKNQVLSRLNHQRVKRHHRRPL